MQGGVGKFLHMNFAIQVPPLFFFFNFLVLAHERCHEDFVFFLSILRMNFAIQVSLCVLKLVENY